MPAIEERHGLDDEDGRHPRRKAALSVPIVIVLLVAFIAWGIPILQGFHFGCNVLAGDIYRENRLGFQMCRAENESERTAEREAAKHEEEAKAKQAAEQRQAEEHQAEQQREAERPDLEADGSSREKTSFPAFQSDAH
jgi:hypothetical protein